MAASDSPATVQQSQLRCLFFDFAPPCALNLVSHDKTISFLLEVIDTMLSISECFAKTLVACCTNNYVILHLKRLSLHFAVGQGLSISGHG